MSNRFGQDDPFQNGWNQNSDWNNNQSDNQGQGWGNDWNQNDSTQNNSQGNGDYWSQGWSQNNSSQNNNQSAGNDWNQGWGQNNGAQNNSPQNNNQSAGNDWNQGWGQNNGAQNNSQQNYNQGGFTGDFTRNRASISGTSGAGWGGGSSQSDPWASNSWTPDMLPPVERKKKKTGLIIAILLILLLLAGGGVGAAVYFGFLDFSFLPFIQKTQEINETSASTLLSAADPAELLNLKEEYTGASWQTTSRIQDMEWKSDTMDRYYVCFRQSIIACDTDERVVETLAKDNAEMGGLDYFDGNLFSTLQSGDKIQLLVMNADNIKDYKLVELPDINAKIQKDRAENADMEDGFAEGITIAPGFENKDEMKLYISCSGYKGKADKNALIDRKIQIYQYDLNAVRSNNSVNVEKTYELDLGEYVKFGIQNLEYDRDTGNIWCAVRECSLGYDLFCINGSAAGTELSLVPNSNGQMGWKCEAAGDGICSLGQNVFYLLAFQKNGDFTSAKLVKTTTARLENSVTY